MVDQNDENIIPMNGMDPDMENENDLDGSRSSISPMEHLDDDENLGDSSNLIPEQDRFLPIANIGRIMKRVVPTHGKIAKEAKECVQECVSEFISFLTSEASDKCLHEKRKTITVEDMIGAMRTLDLDDYADILTIYMKRFREAHRGQGDQVGSPGIFPSDASDDMQDTLSNDASSSNIVAESVPDSFASIAVPASNGIEPQGMRILSSNAQVLVDTSGNQYLTWQTPDGMQIVQLQTTNPLETPGVPAPRSEITFTNVGTNPPATSGTTTGAQQFRPVLPQSPNDAHRGQRQVAHNGINSAPPTGTQRYVRPAPPLPNVAPAKRPRDGKTQFIAH